jgi:NAD(P)H dehydrogenase (quinone)
MIKMLIAYYSRSGNTKALAEAVAEGAKQVDDLDVTLKPIAQVAPKDLLGYQAIVLGSPVYYGTMAWEVKKLLDESVAFHGKLAGRVGGAFATSANLAGGNETTILDILNALLIHGMILRGSASGDHYGPVAIEQGDARSRDQGELFGRLWGELTVKLFKE